MDKRLSLMESNEILDFINILDEESKDRVLKSLENDNFTYAAVIKGKFTFFLRLADGELRGATGDYPSVRDYLDNRVENKLISRQIADKILEFFIEYM